MTAHARIESEVSGGGQATRDLALLLRQLFPRAQVFGSAAWAVVSPQFVDHVSLKKITTFIRCADGRDRA